MSADLNSPMTIHGVTKTQGEWFAEWEAEDSVPYRPFQQIAFKDRPKEYYDWKFAKMRAEREVRKELEERL